jgi:hypothetical protein
MKAYFWKPDKDENEGVAVIAENIKEAKRLGWKYWGSEYGNDNEYIECSCTLNKNNPVPNIEGLPKGVVSCGKDGLRRNIYGWIEDECDICHTEGMLYQVLSDGRCICDGCDEDTNKEV